MAPSSIPAPAPPPPTAAVRSVLASVRVVSVRAPAPLASASGVMSAPAVVAVSVVLVSARALALPASVLASAWTAPAVRSALVAFPSVVLVSARALALPASVLASAWTAPAVRSVAAWTSKVVLVSSARTSPAMLLLMVTLVPTMPRSTGASGWQLTDVEALAMIIGAPCRRRGWSIRGATSVLVLVFLLVLVAVVEVEVVLTVGSMAGPVAMDIAAARIMQHALASRAAVTMITLTTFGLHTSSR